MLFRFVSSLNFLRHATNQHDVHSPFVYDFVTKCLYKKPKKSKKKTLDVLLKSIAYFNIKHIRILENDEFQSIIKKQFPDLSLNSTKLDLIYYKSTEYVKPINVFSHYEQKNDTILIFDNIHRTPKELSYWKGFTQWDKTTVTIDLFYCGIVFFRKEQVKQHFTIRI